MSLQLSRRDFLVGTATLPLIGLLPQVAESKTLTLASHLNVATTCFMGPPKSGKTNWIYSQLGNIYDRLEPMTILDINETYFHTKFFSSCIEKDKHIIRMNPSFYACAADYIFWDDYAPQKHFPILRDVILRVRPKRLFLTIQCSPRLGIMIYK